MSNAKTEIRLALIGKTLTYDELRRSVPIRFNMITALSEMIDDGEVVVDNYGRYELKGGEI